MEQGSGAMGLCPLARGAVTGPECWGEACRWWHGGHHCCSVMLLAGTLRAMEIGIEVRLTELVNSVQGLGDTILHCSEAPGRAL